MPTQSTAEKQKEAAKDCVRNRPPISPMLGAEGFVVGDEGRSWAWQVLLVAAAALGIAISAYVMRRRRAAVVGASREPRGVLEVVATLVAVFGGLVGLAGQFGARIGPEESPPPEATVSVREIHPRVTRGEYATKTNSTVRLSLEDQREVGNVIWLEIHLTGYRDRKPKVQWGLYDADAGEVLLPTTAKQTDLKVESADVQTLILPIWVGYPQSARFKAQFRLLERDRVRQMASTGLMRGSKYRYACKREIHASTAGATN
jgi:hypothetical protein